MKDFYSWPLAATIAATLAALPVAAAVVLAPAAFAESVDGESSSASQSSGSDDSSSSAGEATSEDSDADEDASHTEDVSSEDEEDDIEDTDDERADGVTEGEEDVAEGEEDADDVVVEPAQDLDDDTTAEPFAAPEPASVVESSRSDESAVSVVDETSTTTEVFAETPAEEPDVTVAAEAAERQFVAPPEAALVASQPPMSDSAPTLASAMPVAVAVVQEAFTVTTKVIATVALPLLFWVPEDVPASQAPLLAMLSWVRREFEYIACDLKPTAEPAQMLQDDDGVNVILGTMNAQGANNVPGENQVPLSYTVIEQGANGVATVDENGNWTYVPNDDSPGGADSFVVEIEDDGFHLDNLVGLPGHSTVVTVNVTDNASGADPSELPTGSVATYYIYNLTSSTVNLVWVGQSNPGTSQDNSTNVLAIIQPGQDWGYVMGNNDAHYAVLRTTDTNQIYHVKVQTYRPDNGVPVEDFASCSASGNGASCTPSSKTVTDNVILLDAPGTVVTIPASETQQQNDTLDNLCDDKNVVCDWNIDGRTYYLAAGEYPQTYTTNGGQVLTFSPVKNSSTNPNDSVTLEYSYTYGTDSSQSWSVSETVGANLLDVVNASVTNEYGTSTSVDNSWTESIDLTVSPGETGYIFYQAPMYDVQGDFVIKGGNTTWYVEGTHYYTTATDQVGLWTAESSAEPVSPPAEVYPGP